MADLIKVINSTEGISEDALNKIFPIIKNEDEDIGESVIGKLMGIRPINFTNFFDTKIKYQFGEFLNRGITAGYSFEGYIIRDMIVISRS